MTNIIQIDGEFRIAVSSQFTLQRRAIITPKDGSALRVDWKDNGFHGSVICALKGYARHSLDVCATIEQIIERQDAIEASIKTLRKGFNKDA